MSRDNSLEVSGLAVDWDIKSTPRYCYYLTLDYKKKFLYYLNLNKYSRHDFAKYVSSLTNLWDIARPEFAVEMRVKFDRLYFEKLDYKEVFAIENDLMDWYFKEGYFKTGESYKKYSNIADQIDEER